MNINDMLIEEYKTILDTMKQLDRVAAKVLFLHSDQRLLASVTDGDIRRWILKNGSLTAKVSEAANYSPKFLRECEKELAQEQMKKYSLQALPVVDDENHIVNICLWDGKEFPRVKEQVALPIVIMAGGRGTRLYPFTQVLPKPLIPIGDLTITEHIIQQFLAQGCEKYYLIVNYKKNMIKAYFNEIEKNYDIVFVDEEIPLGTGGGLSLLKGQLEGSFILTNCDILIREDFKKIYDLHKKKGNMITMICAVKSIQVPYGIVEITGDGDIEKMSEKPSLSFLTNTGCYIVESDVLNVLKMNQYIDFPEIIEMCRQTGMKVGVYPIGENAWLDMGQMDELNKMRKRMDSNC